jgi:hypothetical protein
MTKALVLAGVVFGGWGFVIGNARLVGVGVALMAVGGLIHWWRYRL